MKRVLDALFTAIVLLLAIPSTLILASWNAIPGDKMYPVKSGLEDAVIFIFSGTPLLPKVSMKFTDRRLNEATVLLSKKGSTVGYDLLVAEARQTQNYIVQKSDVQSGIQFSKNIDGYKKEIEKKKVEVRAEIAAKTKTQTGNTSTSTSGSTSNTTIATPIPTPTPESVSITVPETTTTQVTGNTIVVNTPQVVVIQEEEPTEVLQKLEDTENQLDEINKEVKK